MQLLLLFLLITGLLATENRFTEFLNKVSTRKEADHFSPYEKGFYCGDSQNWNEGFYWLNEGSPLRQEVNLYNVEFRLKQKSDRQLKKLRTALTKKIIAEQIPTQFKEIQIPLPPLIGSDYHCDSVKEELKQAMGSATPYVTSSAVLHQRNLWSKVDMFESQALFNYGFALYTHGQKPKIVLERISSYCSGWVYE